jgi:hypothetical protein
VADGDVVPEDEGMSVAHDVANGAVLDVGARADADVIDVAADDHAGPDARVFTDDDIADEDGLRVDVGGGGDLRLAAAVGAKQGSVLGYAARRLT